MANPFPFVAGDVLTAAEMNGIGEATAFTPTIDSGGVFTLGNGTLAGRFMRVNTLVVVEYSLVWGSTTTDTGTGEWQFSVPVALGANTFAGGGGIILDAGTSYYRCTAAGNAGKIVFQGNDSGNRITKTVPFTWATGDNLQAVASYEA
jgi:hypothetical protein